MINKVNIIIIGYNLKDHETKCFESVITNTEYPYYITYFNNYQSGLTLTQIWNKLIFKSQSEFICLLNNDTIVYETWLEKLMQTLLSDKKIGFVGPSTNQCHSPQKTISSFEEAQKYKNKVVIMKNPISGFCLLFRKSLFKKLNGFDEKYTLYGQESDLLDRAMQQGYLSAWRQDAFVYHVGEASVNTHGKNIDKERQRAKDIYWKSRKEK